MSAAMRNAYLLGIDIGTSACKTLLVDQSGKIVATEIEGYPLYSERHGWSEQVPDDWWAAVKATLHRIVVRHSEIAGDIAGIGLSGQMHGLVPLDLSGQVIRRAILWNDQRTKEQCEEITAKAGGVDALLALTNNQMLPGYTGGKIVWMRANEPANYERMVKFLNPKDYIRFRLTGEPFTEVSDASGTGLFDVRNRVWSSRLFEILDIPTDLAPDCYESVTASATVRPQIAESLGLPKNLPVVGGGGDAVIQTLGTGVSTSDVLMTTIGTAGVVSTALERFRENPEGKLQVFCNVIPEQWHAMGVTLSAGGSMRWAKEVLAGAEAEVARSSGVDVYDIINSEAEHSSPGANGILFLPYLIGERCPHVDPKARGAFIGLSLTSRKCDLFRSIMEGVIFSFRDVAEIFASLGVDSQHIATSGGGAQSRLWRSIHADIFQKRVVTVSGSIGGAAYGAALVAGVGLEIWPNFSDACKLLRIETETEPNKEARALYDARYALYRSLYPLLKEGFATLSS
jgi:xylulokinase